MFKRNLILKIILSVIALGVVILCVVLLKDSFEPNYEGIITVEIIDIDGQLIKEKEIAFFEKDKLTDLIEENFDNVTFQNGMITSIEDYTTPLDYATFLCIYVDDKMSDVGISNIKFYNGTKISFIITENISDWN